MVFVVVIPIQTISFYNKKMVAEAAALSCHTYPNDKLLQQDFDRNSAKKTSCHTYPNDKLLQLVGPLWGSFEFRLSYLSKR